MTYTQENRKIAIETSLGSDAVLLTSLSGTEGISRLFRFDIEMLATDDSIDFESLIGRNATVRVSMADGDARYINGHFSRFSQGAKQDRFSTYTGQLVPWFWFLTRSARSRIYQNKRVPDIVQQIFSEYGLQDYSLQLYGEFTLREYCVQYRETDFDFISRLLEDEGIFYFFEHIDGKHTLVLANAASAHKPCPGQAQVRLEATSGGVRGDDVITAWNIERELRPGKYAVNDFNFETPATSLRADVSGKSAYEIYDYPGGYSTRDQGDQMARVRLQETELRTTSVSGESDCRALASGYRFQLTDHYRKDQNGWHVVTSVSHSVRQGGDFRSDSSGDDSDFHYGNSFECIPINTPFRPERTTRKPFVQGTQTAMVAGPSGEEIFTDKYGRVKVQFPWDREGQADENSSCWIRVAQGLAGKQWGSIQLPRVGQEVIVDFLEGNPDRPIITGSVYNAEQMPPYALPGERTKSTFKSRSSLGGGGFNEFRFEDKKGSEQVFLHAERNLDVRVKSDSFETVGGDRHIKVSKDHLEEVDGDRNLTVKGDQKLKVDGTVSLKGGTDLEVKIANNYALESGMEIHLKAGMNLVIESGMSLTLKVGGNFVSLSPAGVTISGTMVLINSGGAAGSGAGASPDAPKVPKEADNAQPGQDVPPPRTPPVKPTSYGPQSIALKQGSATNAPFCAICEKMAKERAAQGG